MGYPEEDNNNNNNNIIIPTPHYNSLILEDMFMPEHLKLLHECCQKFPAFSDALKMLKVKRILFFI